MHENLIDKLATLIEEDASVPETADIDECILGFIGVENVSRKVIIEIYDQEKSNKNSKGQVKSKILNTNLSFNFNYDDKKLNLENAYFRSPVTSIFIEYKILAM